MAKSVDWQSIYEEKKEDSDIISPLAIENNLMTDSLASICNKVIHQFQSDFYITPLRLNRDLLYGPPGEPTSPVVTTPNSPTQEQEMPLPPINWNTEMANSPVKGLNGFTQKQVIRKDPGFNFLE